jgi:hypothetical protein
VHLNLAIANTSWLECYKQVKLTLADIEHGIRVKARKKNGVITGTCTISSSVLAFDSNGLARFKFFDRKLPRIKRDDGNGFTPRYKDYVDLWRNPNGESIANQTQLFEEHGDEDELETSDEETPKQTILKMIDQNMKKHFTDWTPNWTNWSAKYTLSGDDT